MKNIINRITNRQTFVLVLLTIFLICSGQGTSDAFFGGIFEAFVDIFGIIVDVIAGTAQIAAEVVGLSIRVVATIMWHTDSLWDLEPFPNGGLIGVVVSNLIHLWDPIIGRTISTLSHDAAVRDIAVSPDGLLLASGSADNTVRVWDPATGVLRGTLIGHRNSVLSVAFSPDGLLLASGSADNTVRLWDATTGTLRDTLIGHRNSVLSVAFSPDGLLLASGSADNTLRVWDATTGTLRGTLTGHTDDVLSVAFSPDGLLLASGSADNTVRLWDPITGTRQATLDHKSPVLSVAFSPDGNMLATGSQDGTARLWDPATEKVMATLGHESPVRRVVFSPDGDILYSTSADGKMRQWEITDETGDASVATDDPLEEMPQQPQPPVVDTGGVTPTLTASTASPLTEATLNEGVVTLTLSGGTYGLNVIQIGNAVSVSGIPEVKIGTFGPAWFGVDRVSDTRITVELGFEGNFNTDSTLTFTVGADAIKGYTGAALTTQISVTAVTESVVATTASPLTEATLDGSVVTLTLSGARYERSVFDIRDAVSVSGIAGVTLPWHQPRRASDTEITAELEFDGDMTTDGTLTFTVGADAIAGYNGPALTAQVPVTAIKGEALLANFPNPFNPETWIPYQLSKPADVTLRIYDLQGRVVRALDLGHQRAGLYQSRSRAAYWDGRNAFGEPVASGVYFYTLTAGDFSATRKMLIRK